MWAFAGWEAVTSLSGEYRNPARDIGRATGIAIAVISVLYLGVAFATVAVLGDHPGKAPLSDLLVLGFGEAARPVTTVVAVLLSVGAINAYFAGGARLGAALARDGSLPVWLATRLAPPARCPRRSLAVVALGGFASLAVITVGDLSLNAPLLMTTGAFALVYAVGTARPRAAAPARTGCAAARASGSWPPWSARAHRRSPAGPGADRGGCAGVDGMASSTAASRASPGLIDGVSAAP